MSFSTFYSTAFVNKKRTQRYVLIISAFCFLISSCSNPLGKGERIREFDEAKFDAFFTKDLLERVEEDEKDHLANYLLARHYLNELEIPSAYYHINEALKVENENVYQLLKSKVLFERKEFNKSKQIVKALERKGYHHIDVYKLLSELY